MKTATISRNGTKPSYAIGGRWVWVSYPAVEIIGDLFTVDEEAYAGFMIEVLMNPTGYDERNLQLALREYLAVLGKVAAGEGNQDTTDAAEDDYLRVVAPRIRSWNAEQDGIHVPAPGERDDPEAFRAFYVIPVHLKQWCTQVVRQIAIPKRRTPPSLPAGNTDRATPTTTPPDLERPTS